ncbi:MAG: indole-3-glycerol phosphate synthase TrpC [Candidatus Eisenbacteria bacterium]
MSILHEICAAKKERVRVLKRERPVSALRSDVGYREDRRSLAAALRRDDDEIRFLCEIKRASPSAGWIREHAEAVDVAQRYREAGAAAISLLTEEQYFRGRLGDLGPVRAVGLPVLMKDFFVDPYQVELARAAGADGLLLIAALGDRPLLEELRAAARELDLEVLVEVHDPPECEIAQRLQPELAGVNNRNLATFEVDLAQSERLRQELPPGAVALAESGIRTRADVLRLAAARFDGLLVGESLMRAADPGAALRTLRGRDDEA